MHGMDAFVQELAEKHGAYLTEAEVERDAWVEELGILMSALRDWLEVGVRRGIVVIDTRAVTLNENDYGLYEAPALTIYLARRFVVEVEPKGLSAALVGGKPGWSKGRVDIFCGGARAILIRRSTNTWQVMPDGRWTDDERGAPLTPDLFAEILRELTA